MYKGAGVLFLKEFNSKKYISLGKRAINPQKNYWSVPGGKLSKVDGISFFNCALRETKEEYFSNEFDLENIVNLNYIKESRIHLPFLFEFRIFLIDVSNLDLKFKQNWEFSQIAWYQLDKLPDKTHLGVKYSLWQFGLIKIRPFESILKLLKTTKRVFTQY